jgi:hypothetical protein
MSKQQKSALDTLNNFEGGYDPPPLADASSAYTGFRTTLHEFVGQPGVG